jgi:hypothetical protein
VLNPLVLFRFGKLALWIQVAYFLKTAFIGGVGLGMSFYLGIAEKVERYSCSHILRKGT